MGERWVFRGGYGITQYMEGTGANQRLTLNTPFFFESQISYDRTSGPGTFSTGFVGLAGARPSLGTASRLGSRYPAAAHASVERVRRVSARIAFVDQYRLRGQRLEVHHHDDRRQPAAAGHRSGQHLAAGATASSALPVQPRHYVHDHRRRHRGLPTTTRCRRRSSSDSRRGWISTPTTRGARR